MSVNPEVHFVVVACFRFGCCLGLVLLFFLLEFGVPWFLFCFVVVV